MVASPVIPERVSTLITALVESQQADGIITEDEKEIAQRRFRESPELLIPIATNPEQAARFGFSGPNRHELLMEVFFRSEAVARTAVSNAQLRFDPAGERLAKERLSSLETQATAANIVYRLVTKALKLEVEETAPERRPEVDWEQMRDYYTMHPGVLIPTVTDPERLQELGFIPGYDQPELIRSVICECMRRASPSALLSFEELRSASLDGSNLKSPERVDDKVLEAATRRYGEPLPTRPGSQAEIADGQTEPGENIEKS